MRLVTLAKASLLTAAGFSLAWGLLAVVLLGPQHYGIAMSESTTGNPDISVQSFEFHWYFVLPFVGLTAVLGILLIRRCPKSLAMGIALGEVAGLVLLLLWKLG